jgi:hypothetical protein
LIVAIPVESKPFLPHRVMFREGIATKVKRAICLTMN